MIVHLLPEAIVDLENVGDYIALDNPRRAVTFIQELRDKCLSLADMPYAFPVVPRYERFGIRHRIYGNYQIFYRVVESDERIDIVHILHSARNYAAILFP
ncbi:type II toxin-antitoxin system RelE/ParE family toxin [Pandoraea sputorum]|uniref:Plasmid stabilisation system protein n=1 Tax=Pandoraea sputorum TaxID=93222 RepID=A0A239SFF7_9BURK|nr:type II toxin-antitoxin system RelE/ParE family toxin [Pandoraea sputorum]AJC16511.1 plasmid stabilization protein [Pandoraea sputorum]SNU83403.1 Plasmid stabilisation system protein [Pandoraea sputorum]VVE58038.1 plasmid stabilization protein [Pandoraea sputorum]